MENIEIWKPIPDYAGYYAASSWGRILSVRYRRILSPVDLGRGYLCVHLSVRNKGKMHYVHRLVAQAFLDVHINSLTVNHLNGIKGDNRPENLELISIAGNIAHACKTGLRHDKGEANRKAKLTDDKVRQIRAMLANGESGASIAEKFGVKVLCIGRIKSGLRWAHVT